MAETRLCPECGAELPTEAPEGLCPKCLLTAGLDNSASDCRSLANRGTDGRPEAALGSGARMVAR